MRKNASRGNKIQLNITNNIHNLHRFNPRKRNDLSSTASGVPPKIYTLTYWLMMKPPMLEPWQATKEEVWHLHWGTSPVGVINVPLGEGCAKYTLWICKWDFISFPSWFPHFTERITVTWETMWWALAWEIWVTPPINHGSELHHAELHFRCNKFRHVIKMSRNIHFYLIADFVSGESAEWDIEPVGPVES